MRDRALPPTYVQPGQVQALVHARGGQGSLGRMTRFGVGLGDLPDAGQEI